MSDQVDATETAISVITESATGVPEPVQKALAKAFEQLLVEFMEVPKAWFRRWSARVNDVTEARSKTMKELRDAAIEAAKGDPDLLAATREIVTPRNIRSLVNRMKVARLTADEINETAQDSSKAAAPDEDWMNKFMRFSEDASSERLQSLFAKILAGEIINPGTFSPSTLRAVSELTQQSAKDFQWLWAKSFGKSVYAGPAFKIGEPWVLLRRLDEAGLVHSGAAATFAPPWNDKGVNAWALGDAATRYWLLINREKDTKSRVDIVRFTQTGLELAKILPPPDYEANLRSLASVMEKNGLTNIILLTPKGSEVIWPR